MRPGYADCHHFVPARTFGSVTPRRSLSRRLMLCNRRNAMSQSSKRVESLAPELERIVSSSESIHDLADGFGGAQGPAEGPLWWREGDYLVFSDIHNNRRMKYEPG